LPVGAVSGVQGSEDRVNGRKKDPAESLAPEGVALGESDGIIHEYIKGAQGLGVEASSAASWLTGFRDGCLVVAGTRPGRLNRLGWGRRVGHVVESMRRRTSPVSVLIG
jgi:hypothetical protein